LLPPGRIENLFKLIQPTFADRIETCDCGGAGKVPWVLGCHLADQVRDFEVEFDPLPLVPRNEGRIAFSVLLG